MMKVFLAAVVTDVFLELGDRGGFGGWWDSVDDETKDEIQKALEKRIAKTAKMFSVSSTP